RLQRGNACGQRREWRKRRPLRDGRVLYRLDRRWWGRRRGWREHLADVPRALDRLREHVGDCGRGGTGGYGQHQWKSRRGGERGERGANHVLNPCWNRGRTWFEEGLGS